MLCVAKAMLLSVLYLFNKIQSYNNLRVFFVNCCNMLNYIFNSDYFVWECFVLERFAIRGCFVRDWCDCDWLVLIYLLQMLLIALWNWFITLQLYTKSLRNSTTKTITKNRRSQKLLTPKKTDSSFISSNSIYVTCEQEQKRSQTKQSQSKQSQTKQCLTKQSQTKQS